MYLFFLVFTSTKKKQRKSELVQKKTTNKKNDKSKFVNKYIKLSDILLNFKQKWGISKTISAVIILKNGGYILHLHSYFVFLKGTLC